MPRPEACPQKQRVPRPKALRGPSSEGRAWSAPALPDEPGQYRLGMARPLTLAGKTSAETPVLQGESVNTGSTDKPWQSRLGKMSPVDARSEGEPGQHGL